MTKNKLVFFGTSEFAVPALEALAKAGFEITVITTPDMPVGRKKILTPPPVKIVAKKLGLETMQPENLKFIENWKLKIKNCSLGIVASYGKIIPQEIINLFPLGILNIHPSLLPKYRGPSPIQTALLNGDTETGVTIIKIDEKVDHGPIVNSEMWIMDSEIRYEELEKQLADLGADLLTKTLPKYLDRKVELKTQDDSQATFTKIIKKEDGKIDWNKSATEIYNQFRAFHKWPGIYTIWQNKILKIIDCEVSGKRLKILKLQPEGGRVMSAEEFINGHSKQLPDYLI